uniref:Uncharacterized protein n=1 Tax=Trichogramma kaykai TaxID=54128 RepID=A0ABD2XMB3_9HYME
MQEDFCGATLGGAALSSVLIFAVVQRCNNPDCLTAISLRKFCGQIPHKNHPQVLPLTATISRILFSRSIAYVQYIQRERRSSRGCRSTQRVIIRLKSSESGLARFGRSDLTTRWSRAAVQRDSPPLRIEFNLYNPRARAKDIFTSPIVYKDRSQRFRANRNLAPIWRNDSSRPNLTENYFGNHWAKIYRIRFGLFS